MIDAELERLSDEQAGVADPDARKALIQQMQKIMYDKAYVIPMYARLDIVVTTKRVTGVRMSSTSSGFWNAQEWDIQ